MADEIKHLQERLRDFLSDIMNEPSIKVPYFKINEGIYSVLLTNCFRNLKIENEEIEHCVNEYEQKLNSLHYDLSNVFNKENEKLSNCLGNDSYSSNKIKQCEEEFKTSYTFGVKNTIKKYLV